MSFQKEVKTDFPTAMPGQDYSLHPQAHTVKIAGAGGVTCGRFVWLADEDTVVATGAAGAAPYGLAELTHYESVLEYGQEASLFIPEGRPVSICLKGEKFVISATAAVAGQEAFVDPATGEISVAGAAPGTSVPTGWKAALGGEAATCIPISTWR